MTELNAHRFCDATPTANANPRREIDVFERRLFDVAVIEVKARRVVAPRCPVCGRRGYCVKVCDRGSLVRALARAGNAIAIDPIALRWAYFVAQRAWSNGDIARTSSSSRVLIKGGLPQPR